MSLRWRIAAGLGVIAALVSAFGAAAAYISTSQRLESSIDSSMLASANELQRSDSGGGSDHTSPQPTGSATTTAAVLDSGRGPRPARTTAGSNGPRAARRRASSSPRPRRSASAPTERHCVHRRRPHDPRRRCRRPRSRTTAARPGIQLSASRARTTASSTVADAGRRRVSDRPQPRRGRQRARVAPHTTLSSSASSAWAPRCCSGGSWRGAWSSRSSSSATPPSGSPRPRTSRPRSQRAERPRSEAWPAASRRWSTRSASRGASSSSSSATPAMSCARPLTSLKTNAELLAARRRARAG